MNAVEDSASSRFRILCGFGLRARGLIGRDPSWLDGFTGVLLVPCGSIHTWLMRRDIDVAFVNAQGRVIQVIRGLGRHKHVSCGQAAMVFERFSSAEPWFCVGDSVFAYNVGDDA